MVVSVAACASSSGPAVSGPAAALPLPARPVNTVLDWPDTPGAEGYDVYFGAGETPSFQGRFRASEFRLETLGPGRTYCWRADPVVGGTPKTSTVQRFTTEASPTIEETHAWPIRIAKALRNRYREPGALGNWNYTEGMVVDGLYSIGVATGREDDITYARQWVDRFVTPEGTIRGFPFALHSLDRVRPAPVLLWFYEKTGLEKYGKAAAYVASMLDAQPTTKQGGYWHRSVYPNQMWLDGIYMADVFAVQYGVRLRQPKYVDAGVKQFVLIRDHTRDPKTGLLYHGWDETRSRPWAHPQTGASQEFWGRAMGWYGMALVDVLDWLPESHPQRAEVLSILRDFATAILPYQDRNSGMWFLVLDKGTKADNYLETSVSLMFAYTLARGAQRGWLPPENLEHGRRATRGVLNREVDLVGDGMDIRGTVEVGTLGGGNGGTYEHYVSVPRRTNDLKSVGAFMYLSLALSETAGR